LMQESLGHKLRVIRAERGLSLREAARRAGVVKETISDIERGHSHPYDVTLAKLAKVYDVSLEELLEEPALAGKAEAPSPGPSAPDPREYDEILIPRSRLTPEVFRGVLEALIEHEHQMGALSVSMEAGYVEVGLAEAPPPPGPSDRATLSEEWRLRLLAPIAPAATALNALFGPKVGANDFTIKEYEQVGEAFVRLDAATAHAMSSEYIHSEEGASEAELAAFNRVGSFHAGGPMYELRNTLQRAYEELVRREKTGVPNIDELRRRVA
jgi:transcriptional regulator with XRE-family HTH domain